MIAGGGMLPAAIRRVQKLFDRMRQLSGGELAGWGFSVRHANSQQRTPGVAEHRRME